MFRWKPFEIDSVKRVVGVLVSCSVENVQGLVGAERTPQIFDQSLYVKMLVIGARWAPLAAPEA